MLQVQVRFMIEVDLHMILVILGFTEQMVEEYQQLMVESWVMMEEELMV
jgi:hypothetical protein